MLGLPVCLPPVFAEATPLFHVEKIKGPVQKNNSDTPQYQNKGEWNREKCGNPRHTPSLRLELFKLWFTVM